MDENFRKERARTVRAMADKADPHTKRRLLDLADKYDEKSRSPTPLPALQSGKEATS